MGIVAYCPQGHRVKVKDELAGKRGLCPTCGMKFRIPRSGDGRAVWMPSAAIEQPQPDVTAGWPVARIVAIDPAVVAALPRALPAESPILASAPEAAFGPAASPLDPAPQRSLHPAIAERVDLAWSIAQPGGEPSPALSAEGMQEWLESRQWTGEEYVWRADWPQWLPFRQVFAEQVG